MTSKNKGNKKTDQSIIQDVSIGNNIARMRKYYQLTQNDVVSKLELEGIFITRSRYAKIECNSLSIRATELITLAKIFHCEINEFFKNISPKCLTEKEICKRFDKLEETDN